MGILIRYFALFVVLFNFTAITFGQNNYAMCEVVEKNGVLSVKFGDEIKYLGSDYIKQIDLYDDKNHLRFDRSFELVNYLTEYWGWEQCGNPIFDEKFKIKTYLLRHKITFNTNLFRQIDIFNKYKEKIKK